MSAVPTGSSPTPAPSSLPRQQGAPQSASPRTNPLTGKPDAKNAPQARTAGGLLQPDPMLGQKRAFADALTRHGGGKSMAKERREEATDGAMGMLAGARELVAPPGAQAPVLAGDVDAQFHAQLDRIAAAIAEFSKSGGDAEMHLSLPLGGYKVEGAVLGRDLAGQINVMLLPGNAVPPAVAAQWSEQLGERLLRRELRLGKVSVRMQQAQAGR